MTTSDALPDDIATLKALLLAERATHHVEIEKLKHTIARLRHEQYGQSAERRELLDQLELRARGEPGAGRHGGDDDVGHCSGAVVRAPQASAAAAARAPAA